MTKVKGYISIRKAYILGGYSPDCPAVLSSFSEYWVMYAGVMCWINEGVVKVRCI